MVTKVEKLENQIMNCRNNLITAREIHNTVILALVEIVGEDHDSAKRLVESSRKFWKSIDKDTL